MDFLKSIGGKIATGVVIVAAVAAGISWWQMDPHTRHAIVATAGKLTGFAIISLCLPWVLFWLVGWVARLDSNAAGGLLVLGLTTAEAIVLAALFRFSIHGTATWALFVAAILAGGVYNLFTCDWIAEKMA